MDLTKYADEMEQLDLAIATAKAKRKSLKRRKKLGLLANSAPAKPRQKPQKRQAKPRKPKKSRHERFRERCMEIIRERMNDPSPHVRMGIDPSDLEILNQVEIKPKDAAEILALSAGRVTELLKAGVLEPGPSSNPKPGGNKTVCTISLVTHQLQIDGDTETKQNRDLDPGGQLE